MAEDRGKQGGLKSRLVGAFRPKPSPSTIPASRQGNKLTKRQQPSNATDPNTNQRRYANKREGSSSAPSSNIVDKQTGERRDYTALLHGLSSYGSSESLPEDIKVAISKTSPERIKHLLASLPPTVWMQILAYTTLPDATSLACSCKTARKRVGKRPETALRDIDHKQERIDFLKRLDKDLPNHLLCFICASYHLRIQRGQEILKPANVLNPLFRCPRASDQLNKQPRIRIAPTRTLPFTFVQLATRADRYSLRYGVPSESLNRRWKHSEKDWSHQTTYYVHNGHLLVRVVSQVFAPPALPPSGQRILLYWPDDWTPYFSACAHWRDGELLPICKCALSHVPKPVEVTGAVELAKYATGRLHQPNAIVNLCGQCQPMRRCPFCPTEYLIQVKLAEDRTDPTRLFKHALVVTRWSDLGDGTSPESPEWASCSGEAEMDSFKTLGKRAISGIFESHFTAEAIPGQRILSLNPKKERRGEAGHKWY